MSGVRVRSAIVAVVALTASAVAVHASIVALDVAATVRAPAERGTAAAVTDTIPRPTTRYLVPVADVERAAWGDTHSTYPATDIFSSCGAVIVSPVTGTVVHVRRVDSWDPDVDDPATRGGRSVAVLGVDGVRYYLAHFDEIVGGLVPGSHVVAGDRLGTMGNTGRSSACHLHVGLSPPCPAEEWRVRRGVVWPHTYLDAWRQGEQLSPRDDVAAWHEANPDACADAAS